MSSFVFSQLNLPSVGDVFGNLKDDAVAKKLQKEISEAQAKLSKSYSQLSEDQNVLCTLYRDFSKGTKDGLGAAADLKQAVKDIQKWREEMENALINYAKSGWGSGITVEEMFSQLFDPFLASLVPLTDIISQMGLQEIPILNTLPQMLQSFSSIGRIVSKMPSEIKNEARKQAKEAKEAEEAAKNADFEAYNKEVGGNKTWNRIVYAYNDDSLLKKIINEIVEAFKALLELIKTICSCAEIFAILLILDKFKPIIDQFKIIVGDVLNTLESIKTVLKALIEGEYAMIKLFGELLWSKVEDIYNIFLYIVSGRDLPSNALISGCWMDIVSAQCDISAATLSIDMLQNAMAVHADEKAIEAYSNKIDEVNGLIEDMKAATPLNAKEIQEEESRLASLQLYKDTIENVKNPKHRDKLEDSIESLERFKANKTQIYAAELAARTSQDDYLNVSAKEIPPST